MDEIIITAGALYADIDVFACTLAYRQLLCIKGINSTAVLAGPLNESVTATVKKWKSPYEKAVGGSSDEHKFILVDISDPKYFPSYVIEENIIELFDHRAGYEEYWKDKLGDKAHIELVGACATQIWNEFKEANSHKEISSNNANLLYTAILSNTLNLYSQNTTEKDKQALVELEKYTLLPENWRENYFSEVSTAIYASPEKAMKNDTKHVEIRGESYAIIQTELWNSKEFVNKHINLIKSLLTQLGDRHTFFTSPSISEGINYLISQNVATKLLLTGALGAIFDGDVGKTNKLWLRKEIIKVLVEGS